MVLWHWRKKFKISVQCSRCVFENIITSFHLASLAMLSLILLALTIISFFMSTEKINFGLFKYSSVYMLLAMLLMVF